MIPVKRSGPKTQADKNREKLVKAREGQISRKEQELNDLDEDAVLAELKKKGLPTFGTGKERLDRLKKAQGIQVSDSQPKKGGVVGNIEAIQRKRDERRRKMEEDRIVKEERKAENEAAGRIVDVEFESMIANYQPQVPQKLPFTPADNLKICVCVRKRPIFRKEEQAGEIDAISCSNPCVIVHEPKLRVDGITKYLENHQFTFDNSFGVTDETTDVYANSLRPLCPFILDKGTVTCFAYGQTGSGKTFTMKGLQSMVVQDLFRMVSRTTIFYVSFYEIYGGKCFDLLNNHEKLRIMEDRNGNIQVFGLVERPAESAKEVHSLIEYGNAARTTHSTTSNDDSSRSHAICQLVIRDNGKIIGTLRLVDLAGSERAQDCMSNNRQRRIEGAEINKSLLALKECIRALTRGGDSHVPYRGSKLTLVLRDSFTGSINDKRIIMITCISPGHNSADHSLNSLRYADRLKEQSSGNVVAAYQPKPEVRPPPKPQAKPAPPTSVQPAVSTPVIPLPIQPAAHPSAHRQASAHAIATPPPIVSSPFAVNHAKREVSKKRDQESEDRFRKSFIDIEYIHSQENEGRASDEMVNFHEKIETILEEEEELLESHVNAIKEDAQLLKEEGALIDIAQGEGSVDYDIDTYVSRMEQIVQRKVAVYSALLDKLIDFKRHLNEEEEFSTHMTRNIGKR